MKERATRIGAEFARGQRLLDSGELSAARAAFEGLLPSLEQAGDRVGQGRVLFQLGSIWEQQGESEQARGCYEGSLAALGDDDPALQGTVLHRLGHLLRSGDPAAARERFQASASLCDVVGDRRGAALSRAMVGQIDFAAMLAALAALPADAPEQSHLIEHVVYFGLRLEAERFAELVHTHISNAALAGRLHALMRERRPS
jgi:hypothetical protein